MNFAYEIYECFLAYFLRALTIVLLQGVAKRNRAAIYVYALQQLQKLTQGDDLSNSKLQIRFEEGLFEKLNNEASVFEQINSFIASGMSFSRQNCTHLCLSG
jgi:hypothetical protein